MEYIITQEEKDNLVPKRELERAKGAITYSFSLLRKSGLSCIYDGKSRKIDYCDKCPLSRLNTPDGIAEICPFYQGHSK